ncbi:MAG: 3-deoxy-7-phosphoheptulonate synthase, partial [Nocardioides sp.]|nr:3-deoxy-7-phosphoheptulonate synthase [Nocardioides sp.]
DACSAADAAQSFLGIDGEGRASLVSTQGNPDTHVILRGSSAGPNYSTEEVAATRASLAEAGLNPRVVVDASHGNSGKSHVRQAEVARELASRVAEGDSGIAGVMLESFLVAGAQKLDVTPGRGGLGGLGGLVRGQSVTDACMDWETTEDVLDALSAR